MLSTAILVSVAISLITSTSAIATEDTFFHSLLKRQAPGTPAYQCHLDCGTAITLSRGSDPCTNDAFLSDYKACLECAGPDNQNIWQYYGATLTTVGTKCGLSTTPVSGETPAEPKTSPPPTETVPPTTSAVAEPATEVPPPSTSDTASSATSTTAPEFSAPNTTAAPTLLPTTSTGNGTASPTIAPLTGIGNTLSVHVGVLIAAGLVAAVL